MAPWIFLLNPGMSDVSPALLPTGKSGLPNDASPLEISRSQSQSEGVAESYTVVMEGSDILE